MLKLRGFALFILAVCAVSFSARAETIMHNETLAPDSLFMQFVTSQTFLEATVARTVRYERQFGLDCQEDFTMSLRGVRVVRPVVTVSDADQITTDGIAIPAGGVWIVGYLMGGCGEDRFYRAVARVADGGGVIIRVLVPGESQLNHMVIPRAQRVVRLHQARLQHEPRPGVSALSHRIVRCTCYKPSCHEWHIDDP